MHKHFDQYLNLKKIILERRPRVVVECGAGHGELTRKLASLLDVYPFELHVISDSPVEGLDPRIKWITGLSYEVLKGFKENSVDLCILDTDHNYWTLMMEFASLYDVMMQGGIIAMHDVETFYYDTGMALKYASGQLYPREEIEKFAPSGSLGCALVDFLSLHKLHFKLMAYHPESHGAAAIEKKSTPGFNVVVPGVKAVFVN